MWDSFYKTLVTFFWRCIFCKIVACEQCLSRCLHTAGTLIPPTLHNLQKMTECL